MNELHYWRGQIKYLESTRESEWRGNLDALLQRILVESALASNALSPRDRQIISLHLLAQLDETECANILCIRQQSVSERVTRAIERFVDAISGTYKPQLQHVRQKNYICVHPSVDKWQIDVLHNRGLWHRVPDDVRQAIQVLFEHPKATRDNKVEDGGRFVLPPREWMGVDYTYYRDWEFPAAEPLKLFNPKKSRKRKPV